MRQRCLSNHFISSILFSLLCLTFTSELRAGAPCGPCSALGVGISSTVSSNYSCSSSGAYVTPAAPSPPAGGSGWNGTYVCATKTYAYSNYPVNYVIYYYEVLTSCPGGAAPIAGVCPQCSNNETMSGWAYGSGNGTEVCIKGCAVKCASSSCQSASAVQGTNDYSVGTWSAAGACSNPIIPPTQPAACTPQTVGYTGSIGAPGNQTHICASQCPAGMTAGVVNGVKQCIKNNYDEPTATDAEGNALDPSENPDRDGDGIANINDKYPDVAGNVTIDAETAADNEAQKGSFSVAADCSKQPHCADDNPVNCSAVLQAHIDHCKAQGTTAGIWSLDEGCAAAFRCDASADKCQTLKNTYTQYCAEFDSSGFMTEIMDSLSEGVVDNQTNTGSTNLMALFGSGAITDPNSSTVEASTMFNTSEVLADNGEGLNADCPADMAMVTSLGTYYISWSMFCQMCDLIRWAVIAIFAYTGVKAFLSIIRGG